MIFLTFLFYFLFVSKNSFVVHSVSLWKKFWSPVGLIILYQMSSRPFPSSISSFLKMFTALSFASHLSLLFCTLYPPLTVNAWFSVPLEETIYATTIILSIFTPKVILQTDPVLYPLPKYLCLRQFIEKLTHEQSVFAQEDGIFWEYWMEHQHCLSQSLKSEAYPMLQLSHNETWNRLN